MTWSVFSWRSIWCPSPEPGYWGEKEWEGPKGTYKRLKEVQFQVNRKKPLREEEKNIGRVITQERLQKKDA